MKKTLNLIVVLLIAFIFCVGQLPAAEEKKTWSAKASQKDYLIGSGDILEITTWKELDFTREGVLVRLDGKLTFPLLNDVQKHQIAPQVWAAGCQTKRSVHSTPTPTERFALNPS